jgi:hypothetical protein
MPACLASLTCVRSVVNSLCAAVVFPAAAGVVGAAERLVAAKAAAAQAAASSAAVDSGSDASVAAAVVSAGGGVRAGSGDRSNAAGGGVLLPEKEPEAPRSVALSEPGFLGALKALQSGTLPKPVKGNKRVLKKEIRLMQAAIRGYRKRAAVALFEFRSP